MSKSKVVINSTPARQSIMLELDEGESEVITIAKEKLINTVVIDEFAGRQYASLQRCIIKTAIVP